MWALAVLKEIDALPGAQGKLPVDDGYRKMHTRQCRAQMGGHVVSALVVMLVSARVFRGNGPEKSLQVRAPCSRSIFLDQKRCRMVSAKEPQKTPGPSFKPAPTPHLV